MQWVSRSLTEAALWLRDALHALFPPTTSPAQRTRRDLFLLTAISLVSWLLVALPLPSLSDLWRYWDGPMYMIVARTLYRVPLDNPITQAYGIPPESFAPFLLGYPVAIRVLATVLSYQASMIVLSVALAALSAVFFYLLLRDLDLTPHPLWLSVVFLFIPYRWLIYRSVAATEPMFLAALLGALWLLQRRRYFAAAVLAAVACVTRVQGILVLPAFLLAIAADGELPWPRRALLGAMALAVIPSLLLANAAWHGHVYGDPLIYFAVNQRMMGRVPFGQMLRYASHMTGGIVSMEGYLGSQLFLLLYAINLIGLARLWSFDHSRGKTLFVYALCTTAFLSLVTAEDLARFMIAAAPFTWVLGLRDLWEDRRALWALPWVILLTYLYTWRIIPRGGVVPRVAAELAEWIRALR